VLNRRCSSVSLLLVVLVAPALARPTLDERPAKPGEWGYRPAEGATSRVTPPAFTWRPKRGLAWELEVARHKDMKDVVYRVRGLKFSAHCPPKTLPSGAYSWRYRGVGSKGTTHWSKVRSFRVAKDAAAFPLPPREELLARVPRRHPRLFVRPEGVAKLAGLAKGSLAPRFAALVRRCEQLLRKPPSVEEPPRYPRGTVHRSEAWRKIWWGNRRRTVAALEGAATLAFTRLLGGKLAYGQEAKRILLACAKWDPTGSTGYLYNDEAGMPYAYHFARTYTFVADLLSEAERATCRAVLRARGREIYAFLCPSHLWWPYSSHSNRAWHFLGELGIALLGEVPEAADWLWFALQVQFTCYPVWGDADGGWHEGMAYWSSYQARFTWWADVMREALRIDIFRRPYYAQTGYYGMYMLPPHKRGGGFGDQNAAMNARRIAPLMATLAAQSKNPHWRWWVEQVTGKTLSASFGSGYVGFLRASLEAPAPRAPTDLPTSRLFAGTGQAVLTTGLGDARKNVHVVFKSSPFGTQSHGYDANNAFLLWAYGKRLLIRSGKRDMYGSRHHSRWMWSTRSVNSVVVGKRGQVSHSANAKGRIAAFKTTPQLDLVVGEAAKSYGQRHKVDRFQRALIFAKPDLLVVYDRLESPKPETCDYWLHSPKAFEVTGPRSLRIEDGGVGCDVEFLVPAKLGFTRTNQYDPNPRPRVKLREWHLRARTAAPQRRTAFVALYRLYRGKRPPTRKASLERLPGGYALRAEVAGGELRALLPDTDLSALKGLGLRSRGGIVARVERGAEAQTVEIPHHY
jgi:hypothetical protein